MEDFETQIKVLVLGNGGVGKTSLIRRFCSNQFSDTYQKTIGVDFLDKELRVDALHRTVRLQLWDTAGQEEFDALTRSYYRGAKAAVLVFSTPDVAALAALPQWKAKVEAECGQVAMAMVQNKCDLLGGGGVSAEAAEAMARRLGLRFYRTCVREGLNCDAVFSYLVERVHQSARAGLAAAGAPTAPQPLQLPGSGGASGGGGAAAGAGASGGPRPPALPADAGKQKLQKVDLAAKPARRRLLNCTVS